MTQICSMTETHHGKQTTKNPKRKNSRFSFLFYRPKKELDWGVHQVDTIIGSTTTTGNQFVVLTSFGDHALHHLFPTIDQGKLRYLYPVFLSTMKQFGVELKHKSSPELVWGLLKQLMRNRPNTKPPKPVKST